MINIDILKLNHWLNARKITLPIIKKKIINFIKKLRLIKTFQHQIKN